MPHRLPARPNTGRSTGIPPARHSLGPHAPNRRTVLRAAGGTVIGGFALAAIAGCTDDTIHEPDPLAAQELRARADAAAATAAIALDPQRATTLKTIAAERTAHADALRTEIERVIGVYGDGTTPVRRTPPPSPTTTPVEPPDTTALRDRLSTSRRSALDLALDQSGYRAGLLASISAACAVHVEVLLA
ncbi:hypothetical protein [Nocardia paucivorans]|uniref:hypothetical protein n=1 Tax=Nocardia paucivorans TaxID=114259 RepID=UPI001FDF1D48|nr:hypothetical protein [Nocardia paucivorans]